MQVSPDNQILQAQINSPIMYQLVINYHQTSSNSYFNNHLGLKKSRKLFEPLGYATNLKVGNWSRYCKSHVMVKNHNDFCKVWIGIKWDPAIDPAASRFRYESTNSPLGWSNFMYPENFIGKNHSAGNQDQCKYRTFDKKGKLVLR